MHSSQVRLASIFWNKFWDNTKNAGWKQKDKGLFTPKKMLCMKIQCDFHNDLSVQIMCKKWQTSWMKMQFHFLTTGCSFKQKYPGYPGTQSSTAQFSVSDTRLSWRRKSNFCIRYGVYQTTPNTRVQKQDSRFFLCYSMSFSKIVIVLQQ